MIVSTVVGAGDDPNRLYIAPITPAPEKKEDITLLLLYIIYQIYINGSYGSVG
jgi:hypothetical protein